MRISFEQQDDYNANNSTWFSLKEDKEKAVVQFLANNVNDIPMFTVHRVKVDGKERNVNCLRQDVHDSVEVCPFCAAGLQAKVARFVLLYNIEASAVQVWERGKKFVEKLIGNMNRYSPFSRVVMEVERHGVRGDKQTTYELYPRPDMQAVDLSNVEIPNLEDGVVLNLSYDEMEKVLRGESISAKQEAEQQPIARRVPVNAQQPTNKF